MLSEIVLVVDEIELHCEAGTILLHMDLFDKLRSLLASS